MSFPTSVSLWQSLVIFQLAGPLKFLQRNYAQRYVSYRFSTLLDQPFEPIANQRTGTRRALIANTEIQ